LETSERERETELESKREEEEGKFARENRKEGNEERECTTFQNRAGSGQVGF
jgi:hypothetical protein